MNRLVLLVRSVGWCMSPKISAPVVLGLLIVGAAEAADLQWGSMAYKGPYRELTVKAWPANRLLPMRTPFPNVVSAWIEANGRRSIHWMFSPDARQMALGLPPQEPAAELPKVYMLTTEKTTEHADGTIVLSALDAKVVGERAKLETNPGNHRIGYWTNPSDYVEWTFESRGKGEYDVEIAYSRSGPPGAQLSLELDDAKLPVTLATTGNWYVYTGHDAGRIKLSADGRHVARVKCVDPKGDAVMNLKAVVLRPRP